MLSFHPGVALAQGPRLLFVCVLAASATGQTFTDRSANSGVRNETSHAPALADVDGDGDLDLYTTTEPGNIFTPGYPRSNLYYRNNLIGTGSFGFVDVTVASGLENRAAWSQDVQVADFNRDGRPDIYISNLVIAGGTPPNQLYLGQANGTFLEVATQSGATGGGSDNVGQIVDFDGDGWTDLYTCQRGRNYLLRNLGVDANGIPTFQSFGSLMLQDLLRDTWSAAWCDVDLDGKRDVFLANRADIFGSDGVDGVFFNRGGGNVMFDGRGFNDVVLNGFSAWGDYDCDGDPDLYVSNWQTYSGTAVAATHGQLYRNDGAAGFTNVTTALLPGIPSNQELSIAWADIDNDGDLDLYVTTADIFSPALLWQNQLRETGQVGFLERAAQAGINDDRFLFGCAFGDLDRNGFLDLVTTCEGDLFNHYYTGVYLNAGTNGNHWIGWRPRGTLSAPMAEGLRASLLTPDGHRQWFEIGAMSGTYGQNAPELHFGIGANTAIQELTLHWPSGVRQSIANASIDTLHDVVETGLVLRGAPVLNGTVEVQVGGPPNDIALTFIAAASASIPLPPFGTLGLDPLTLSVFDVRTLPLSARHDLPVPIPNDGSLVGGTIWFQALIGPLSNPQFRNVSSVTIQ